MRRAESGKAMVAPDVEFHLALLAAANNELLSSFSRVIEWALPSMFEFTTGANPKPASVLPLHEEVVKSVRRGSPEAARKAMNILLEDTDKVVQERLTDKRQRKPASRKESP